MGLSLRPSVPASGPRPSGAPASTRRGRTGVIGIDLAGSPRRDSGVCILEGPRRLRTQVLHSDAELRSLVRSIRPDLVVIDAPLSLPRGRRTIEDRSGPHLRKCDRELLRLRLPFFPITLGPMRMLTVRGTRLAHALARDGTAVVEGYPGGAQDLWGIPRKTKGVAQLQRRLKALGLGGDLARRPLTHDELDAVTIAWVGWTHLKGRGVLIGDPAEGVMLLPRTREFELRHAAHGGAPLATGPVPRTLDSTARSRRR